jgi:hypothetical protein
MPKKKQMTFAPNSGYAFAVGTDTWHSAHAVGPEVRTRDSILLTYFVDAGVLRYLRNRGKRFAQFRPQRDPQPPAIARKIGFWYACGAESRAGHSNAVIDS